MVFSMNLPAALLAVAAVGVKGSPAEPPQSLSTAVFCPEYGFKGNCNFYNVSVDVQCKNIDGPFDNSAYSFASDPGIKCIAFE